MECLLSLCGLALEPTYLLNAWAKRGQPPWNSEGRAPFRPGSQKLHKAPTDFGTLVSSRACDPPKLWRDVQPVPGYKALLGSLGGYQERDEFSSCLVVRSVLTSPNHMGRVSAKVGTWP